MKPAYLSRRRPRNRPSIHPRFILIRQWPLKCYRLRKSAKDRQAKTRHAYYRIFTCVLSTVLGTILALYSDASYSSACGRALLCYTAYCAADVAKGYILPVFKAAGAYLGLDGVYSL